MMIHLNGDAYELPSPASIADLLARLDIDPRRVPVERNFVVVKRDLYTATALGDGDQIEIVNFVGGGSSDPQLRARIREGPDEILDLERRPQNCGGETPSRVKKLPRRRRATRLHDE